MAEIKFLPHLAMGQVREQRMNSDGKMQLFMELLEIEKKGIALWLEGSQSSSRKIADAVYVNEDNAYMRDYVYDEGVLKELRFDRVHEP